VLVIKLGALGDFIHAFHAFAAIRAHHAGQHIALLTSPPFEDIARMAPWFNEVLLDPRPQWWRLGAVRKTVQTISRFAFVYDLQTSHRSSRYFRLAGRPPWSGIAPGCSHPHANPDRDYMHTLERQREQLRFAGLSAWPVPDRSWLINRGQTHDLGEPYALLMPGGAGGSTGARKRWPAKRYGQLARVLTSDGLTPVVIGGPNEVELAQTIREACPEAIDLTKQTSIADIAALGARATLVLGNDTGPVHLAAAVGAPTVALFSSIGIPNQAAPRGPNGEWVRVLHIGNLEDLAVETVIEAMRAVYPPAQIAADTPRSMVTPREP
jgi:ADP-heptose:LPS heptosyltransferase